MPANLPPQYFDAEARYKEAQTDEERVARLEELIRTVPKHKGTEKLRGDLKKRLSKLKNAAQAKKKTSRQTSIFHIEREGAGQVVLVGPTNVGKSALVNYLTNAAPEVSEVPYTTWTPTPGMMKWQNIQIQLVDTPPLDRDFIEPQLIELIRNADLLLILIDLQSYAIDQLQTTLEILENHRIMPIQEKTPQSDPRISFLPFLILVNKNDDPASDEEFEVFCELFSDTWSCQPVSAITGRHMDSLCQRIFELLDILRVYSKPPGTEADLSAPFVLKNGSTVEDFAAKVHKDFLANLKSARIWGTDVYDGQLVGRDHLLQDGDIVELRI